MSDNNHSTSISENNNSSSSSDNNNNVDSILKDIILSSPTTTTTSTTSNIDTTTHIDDPITTLSSPSSSSSSNQYNTTTTIDYNNNNNNNDKLQQQEEQIEKLNIEERFNNLSKVEVFHNGDEVIFIPRNTFEASASDAKFQLSRNDMITKGESFAFLTELPSNLSCTPFLKSFFSCYTPVGFLRNYYRYGGNHCDAEAQNFRDCTLLSMTFPNNRPQKFEKILKEREDIADKFYQDHVWKRRSATNPNWKSLFCQQQQQQQTNTDSN
ncbi:hypothetical protein DFA_11629 [Cavenderia fasciculata]|uniref:Uncharacterized protein n=1 Tax=Cavenderia fasciculata TaxID=261658 RepID=F4QDS1_CACFS|nr:uncharacterized protein DFA_11629 [Cavenderia fasciculata]EGG13868.1 hypothetical protein DFA_11629 [Cavenderia fasciculata]|eukprot:XP_004350576.1 hypothetical protein DFA_11629 [Cavenderia fasciculata]